LLNYAIPIAADAENSKLYPFSWEFYRQIWKNIKL
jgi:hypothetical protein